MDAGKTALERDPDFVSREGLGSTHDELRGLWASYENKTPYWRVAVGILTCVGIILVLTSSLLRVANITFSFFV